MPSDLRSVLVAGAGGQLGQAIVERCSAHADVHALGRGDLDITRADAVAEAVARCRPSLVVNCAAFNDVDGAEERQAEAIAINGLAVGILARAAAEAGAVFVHYGTDFVFAGREPRLWTEADPPEPESVYAQSKLMGEWLAADCPRHYVLRVESLFGGAQRRSTIDRIVAALSSGRSMTLFHDRTVTPSFVDDVAAATWQLVRTGAPYGVYHCTNDGVTTWAELGRVVAERLSLDPALVVPVSVAEAKMKAPRPQYAALSNARLAQAGVPMASWQDALDRYLARLPA